LSPALLGLAVTSETVVFGVAFGEGAQFLNVQLVRNGLVRGIAIKLYGDWLL
jgi:hypothetical protein